MQKLNGRFVFHYKDDDKLEKTIKQLKLEGDKSKSLNDNNNYSSDLEDEDDIQEISSYTEDISDEEEEKLIDKIINADRGGSLNDILSLANLR